VGWLQLDRSLTGGIRRGVFSGTLVSRVRTLRGSAGARIPVLAASTSIATVELDGRGTSLLSDGTNYTVAIDEPGDHTLRIEFFVGRDDARFARKLDLALPPSGPTAVSVLVPEADIDATLAGGAITSLQGEAGATRIVGQLDGRGRLELAWKGRSAADAGATRLTMRENVLYTLSESLLKGVAQVDAAVLEGETDRLRLRVPAGVEIVDVTGESVLQWRTDGDRLEVLLRWLESEATTVQVQFQSPVEDGAPVALRMPLPEEGVAFSGAAGVQGAAGFSAAATTMVNATRLQDLPPELAALTPNPLLLGFELTGEPTIELSVSRQPALKLSATAIDELEASTVMIEDGAEITRMQLHVRNQTQQYLALRLPEGARLSYARIDGAAVRPAESPDGANLLPLIQSDDASSGAEFDWTVQDGDTLGALSDRFYGDPSLWQRILDNNPGFYGDSLAVGQVLRIAPVNGVQAVRRFVIDVAWTRDQESMGLLGSRSLTLPSLDAEVGSVEWLVFVPTAFEPLHFSGSLAPYSHLRYDHFRRVQQFLDAALGIHGAWAGGSEAYSSILTRRKAIYAAEASGERRTEEVSGTFPLVGDSYRFKRLLPGRDAASLGVTWVSRRALPPVRVGAFAASIALIRGWRRGGRLGRRVAIGAGFGVLLVVAWFVEGVHRSLVWGADAALLVACLGDAWDEIRGRFADGPPTGAALLDRWTFSLVARVFALVILAFVLLWVPLLWSSILLLALGWRLRRSA
jgi:nucleoid-associated protein YgaU